MDSSPFASLRLCVKLCFLYTKLRLEERGAG